MPLRELDRAVMRVVSAKVEQAPDEEIWIADVVEGERRQVPPFRRFGGLGGVGLPLLDGRPQLRALYVVAENSHSGSPSCSWLFRDQSQIA